MAPAPKSNPKISTARTKSTQLRGDQRRERLLRAAYSLLERYDVPDLTYAAVCAEARVPTGSARFFYPDLDSLLHALLRDLEERHDAALALPLRKNDLSSWHAIIHCFIDRSARFQRANPVFSKLTISGTTPPSLKLADRRADRALASRTLDVLDKYFVLPRIPNTEMVAYLAVEVVDLAFMLSMIEASAITPAWLRQAKIAVTALLAQHFGENLSRRPSSPASGAQEG